MFDPEYYDRLYKFINDDVPYFKEEIWHSIDAHSDNPEKMLFHLKCYIDNRIAPTELEVTLSDDYKKFKIYEFFKGLIGYGNLPSTKPYISVFAQMKNKEESDKLERIKEAEEAEEAEKAEKLKQKEMEKFNSKPSIF